MRKKQERELEEGIEGINDDRNNKIFHGKGDLLNQKDHRKREILNQIRGILKWKFDLKT